MAMTISWKRRQRRNPSQMLLLLKVLALSCMLLAATALGDENAGSSGECESGNEGNDPEQCLAAAANANANANTGEKEIKEDTPWYRNLSASECKDDHEKCEVWAAANECASVPDRYLQLCPKACKVCDNERDTYVANCYGEDQHVTGDKGPETAVRVREVEDYMLGEVFVEEKYAQIRADCKNRNELCSFWAVIGGKNIIQYEKSCFLYSVVMMLSNSVSGQLLRLYSDLLLIFSESQNARRTQST